MQDYNFNYSSIESTAEPIYEVAQILRNMGQVLVNRLFSQGSPAERRLPALNELLSPQQVRALTELHIWKLKSGTAGAAVPAGKGKGQVVLKDLVSRALAGQVKPREWQLTFQNRLVAALGGGTRGNGLPEALDPILEKAAWEDLRFRRFMTSKVVDYLREEVLLIPGEFRVPDFSTGVFWALLGLTGIESKRVQKRLLEMMLGILQAAREQTLKEGWAGFWDQWLLLVAIRQWPQAFDVEDDAFCLSLQQLPLLAKSVYSTPKLAEDDARKVSARERKQKKKKSAAKVKIKTVSLAHPDWEKQMPSFFRKLK